MKTTYTVPEVPGSKRSSERPYTHALVGRYNVAAARAAIGNADDVKQFRKDWKWHKEMADLGAGGTVHVTGCARPWSYQQSEKDHAEHVAFIAKHPTPEAYVEHRIAEGHAYLTKRHGDGDQGPLEVLQWSMSAANAAKGESQQRNRNFIGVRIVACAPVEKPAKKAKAAA